MKIRRMGQRSIGFWRLALAMFIVSLSFLIFRYVGNFSKDQTNVLSLFVFLLLVRYTIQPKGTLPPHRIEVVPHWKNILVDHNIISKSDFDRLDSLSHAGSNEPVWLDSIAVEVLSPNLFYSRRYNTFTTKWYVDETVLTRLPTDKQARAELRTQFPKLFREYTMRSIPTIRIAIEGGQVFLLTDESMQRGGEYGQLPESRLLLATIPSFLFSYYRGYLLSEVSDTEFEACFKELGWERDAEWDDVYLSTPRTEYTHKYFSLIIRPL